MRRVAKALAVLLASGACGHGGGPGQEQADGGAGTLDSSLASADASPPPTVPPASDPPTIPVGLEAYRAWDRWPALRVGMRAYMQSTYDRSGGNEAADASHFIRQESANANIALDVAGPGVLLFARANHWHGSPWHYRVDGTDRIVSESNTANPDQPDASAVFLPAPLFPPPLAVTWPTTMGADLMSVPLGFEHSLVLAYERSHYGTGYFIYDAFPEGAANLSSPIHAWDGATPPDPDVVALVARAGDDVAPQGSGVRIDQGTIDVPVAGAATVIDLAGARTLRVLRFTVPKAAAVAFGHARLRVTWDGRNAPSIDAPLALFFGAGTLFNRDAREYLVKSFPMVVRFDASTVELSAYFPMPFTRHAHVEITGAGDAIAGVGWRIRSVPNTDPANHVGYFHATYVDHGMPAAGRDLVLLDTTTTEGGGPFCGSFVGDSVIFSDRANLTTLEGDPRFYFDDSNTPQAQGTGTEEWGGGGDYWGGLTTTLPFLGHPVGAPDQASAAGAEDQIESMYRFLLADLFPFGKSARIQMEHGGTDDSTEHYRTVAYWYGLPGACLVEADALHVGDPADESKHRYVSPDASPPETLTSRFEGGVDHVGAVEVMPTVTDVGRHTTGTSEFSLAIASPNLGVMLRRLSDSSFPDQRADVFVADDRDGAPFVRAGTWYAAGSNQDAYVNAATETGPGVPFVQTVDRRWREDELLIARALTDGRSAIRVRVVFKASALPVAPGAPVGAQAWSEYRYHAFVWRLPAAP